jgi:ABC-type sugar transport system ATPase subunit
VAEREGDRLVVDCAGAKLSVLAEDGAPEPGASVAVSVRAAAVQVEERAEASEGLNEIECEIEFVEYLGDLVKLHLISAGERLLAKVAGDLYPDFRGREGGTVTIGWKEEDVQLLRA